MCSNVTCQGCQRVGLVLRGHLRVIKKLAFMPSCQLTVRDVRGVVLLYMGVICQGPMGLTPGSGVTTCQG